MLSSRILWDEFLMKAYYAKLFPEGTIIDIGTGFNTTVMEMFDKNEVIPTDLYPDDYAKEVNSIKYLDASDWSTSEFYKENVDGIIISEVLEHIVTPQDAIRECYEHLNNKGVLLGTAPFFYRIHDSDPNDIEIREEHLNDYWRFTPKGIRVLLEKAGFRETYVCGLPPITDEMRTPQGIGFWAIKGKPFNRIAEWNVSMPERWRDIQIEKATKFKEIYNAI